MILENAFDTEVIDAERIESEALFAAHAEVPGACAGRIQDAWKDFAACKRIATNSNVMDVLSYLYERGVVPFQTLSFPHGTQQPAHSDTIHF
ncbi:MAG: phytanoyl-CoA dioxygenase, partial [Acidimicrobiales bacterium]